MALTDDELLNAYQAAGGSPAELPMRVSRAPGAPAQAINAYDAATFQGANERMDLLRQQGQQQAANHDEQGSLYGEQAAQSRSDADVARGRAMEARDRGDQYTAEADRVYNEMKAHANPPGPKAIEKVMGILGGVMAMGGNQGGAYGAQLVGSLLGSGVDRERWAAEQEHNTRLFQAATSGKASAQNDEAHQFDIAQKMIAADAHYYNAALEEVKQRGLSQDAVNAATQLQMDVRDKALQYGRALEVQKQKAAASAGKNRKEAYFWSVPLDQLRQMPSQILGEDGQKVLAQRIKNDQTDRSGEEGIAGQQLGNAKNAAALAAKGAEEGPQEVLPGRVATVPLEKRDVSDIRHNAQILEAIKTNYQRLAEIRARNKWLPLTSITSANDVREAKAIMSEMTGQLNQFSGRGAPSNAELEDVKGLLLDPTDSYLVTDPAKVYQAQIARLDRSFNGQMNALGIVDARAPAGGAPPPASAAGPAATPKVIMVRPADGKVFEVDPSKVDKAQSMGLVPQGAAPQPGPAVAGFTPRASMASRILGAR